MHYLEVKQLLLQSYCQAITFYLLLKSEGHPVRDHPVSDRLVEISNLIRKVVVSSHSAKLMHSCKSFFFSFWLVIVKVSCACGLVYKPHLGSSVDT